MTDWDAPLDWLQRYAFWAKVGHGGWIVVVWFRDEAKELLKREVKIMIAWLKRLIIGKLEDEARLEIASLIRQEQAKVQTLNADDLAKSIVNYVNVKLGITGGQ